MSAPIFVDPILDGAADPTVIRNNETGEWWMFYTNRRAHTSLPGTAWIHGCPIGVAISPDGVSWRYSHDAAGLDDPEDPGLNTHWAPEVIFALGEYHMYLTYIRDAPDSFVSARRKIIHLTSRDLRNWIRHGPLDLKFENAIDACVAKCPDGLYRLWYKSEEEGSSTWAATSPDLYRWTVEQRVIPGGPAAPPHEGPNVFSLGGHHWMITDEWSGQAVYRSSDMRQWTRQGTILEAPGSDPMDRRYARHADVVVQDDWAALYYFSHPEWDEGTSPEPETPTERRSVIHFARIWVEGANLLADRNAQPQPLH